MLSLSETILEIEGHYGFPCDIEWAFENRNFYIVQSRPITTLVENKDKLIFQKFFSRELPLVTMEYWWRAEYNELYKIIDGYTHFTPLYVVDGNGFAKVYYDLNNPDTYVEPLFRYIKEHREKFPVFVDEFTKMQTEIESLLLDFKGESFKKVFDLMTKTWGYLPIWLQLANHDAEYVSKDFAVISATLRDNYQKIEYRAGEILREAIGNKYPELAKYSRVISAAEFIENKLPSIEVLEKRFNGFILFRGKLIVGSAVEDFAQENNIELVDEQIIIGKDTEVYLGKPFYSKMFTREYSLPIVECWSRGESTDPRQYTETPQEFLPYIVFHNVDGLVTCYMDKRGIDHINVSLQKCITNDFNFPKKASETFVGKLSDAHAIWSKNRLLDLQEIKLMLKSVRSAWPWFEAIWWLAENINGIKDEDRKLLVDTRQWGEGIGSVSDKLLINSLKDIYPSLSNYVSYIGYDEIMSGKIPPLETLKERSINYVYAMEELSTDKKLSDLEKQYGILFEKNISKDESYNKELRGEIAYKGVATGKVKIIRTSKDVAKVTQGDIIVSHMTTPDFVPCMKLAGAIVTDEGGIMCHAAIVARELKKPCITGTRVATQVLKDGDLVEVDADNGVVRILEKLD